MRLRKLQISAKEGVFEMAKILVVTMGKEASGTRLHYKSFEVVSETKQGYKVRNTSKSAMLGKDFVRHAELERVVFAGPTEAKAIVHIDGEVSQADMKAMARQWYKVLRQQAMSRLRRQNTALKEMFRELEGLAI